MKALTLWPEWLWAILYLGKRVENRRWVPTGFTGERIALHAGAHIGGRAGRSATRRGLSLLGEMAALHGWSWMLTDDLDYMSFYSVDGKNDMTKVNMCIDAEKDMPMCKPVARKAIVATAVIGEVFIDDLPPWGAAGNYHWHLRDVVALSEPVPAKGRQKLWSLNAEQEEAVERLSQRG